MVWNFLSERVDLTVGELLVLAPLLFAGGAVAILMLFGKSLEGK